MALITEKKKKTKHIEQTSFVPLAALFELKAIFLCLNSLQSKSSMLVNKNIEMTMNI